VSREHLLCALVMPASIAAILLYAWPVFFVALQLLLQITAFIAVTGLLGIPAWMGYTLATTPAPRPIEAELKGLEEGKEGEGEAPAKAGAGS
jgi:predicted DNA-binding transcriptional regulator